jgi:hypothetical protein
LLFFIPVSGMAMVAGLSTLMGKFARQALGHQGRRPPTPPMRRRAALNVMGRPALRTHNQMICARSQQ